MLVKIFYNISLSLIVITFWILICSLNVYTNINIQNNINITCNNKLLDCIHNLCVVEKDNKCPLYLADFVGLEIGRNKLRSIFGLVSWCLHLFSTIFLHKHQNLIFVNSMCIFSISSLLLTNLFDILSWSINLSGWCGALIITSMFFIFISSLPFKTCKNRDDEFSEADSLEHIYH